MSRKMNTHMTATPPKAIKTKHVVPPLFLLYPSNLPPSFFIVPKLPPNLSWASSMTTLSFWSDSAKRRELSLSWVAIVERDEVREDWRSWWCWRTESVVVAWGGGGIGFEADEEGGERDSLSGSKVDIEGKAVFLDRRTDGSGDNVLLGVLVREGECVEEEERDLLLDRSGVVVEASNIGIEIESNDVWGWFSSGASVGIKSKLGRAGISESNEMGSIEFLLDIDRCRRIAYTIRPLEWALE
jgi:hypothetical protein